MQNNIYIITWKTSIQSIINAKELLYKTIETKYDPTNDIRELASKQLTLLDDAKPDKEKSLYSQGNKEQKEFIDYLEKVILFGNIEGENNIKI